MNKKPIDPEVAQELRVLLGPVPGGPPWEISDERLDETTKHMSVRRSIETKVAARRLGAEFQKSIEASFGAMGRFVRRWF